MLVKKVIYITKIDNGYKLTYLGYDYLALQTFMKRGVIKDVICKIGVGK
jgi:RIO kinase 2